MTSNALSREHDKLFIPEGFYQEAYTPAAGRITSTALGGKKLQYCKFMLSADATVTWKDHAGNQVTAFALKAGYQPFLVSEIISVSAGTVLIIHDGIVATTDASVRDMTSAFSITAGNP